MRTGVSVVVEVTREQALAFVEALCGVHGSEGPIPNSIGAWHHFEAVLGYGNLRDAHQVRHGYEDEKVRAFLDYLQAVVNRLRPGGWGRCGTCGHRQPHPTKPNRMECLGVPREGVFGDAFYPDVVTQPFGCTAWTLKDGDAR